YCGDQKYLDEWPSLYPGLVILKHPGGGVAPWNVEAHTVSEQNGQVVIDGRPLIFYHFHALRVVLGPSWGRWFVIPSLGYDFTPAVRRLIYGRYVRALRKAAWALNRSGLSATALAIPFRSVVSFFRRGQLVIG